MEGQMEKGLNRQVGAWPCVLGHGWWAGCRNKEQPLQGLKVNDETQKEDARTLDIQ